MKTLLQWFSDKKGLATGIAVMGFGFSSFLAAPVIRMLIDSAGLVSALIVMGISYALLILLASLLLTSAPETTQAAANIVGIMAVCNGAGRLFWSALSDYTGRPIVYSSLSPVMEPDLLVCPPI